MSNNQDNGNAAAMREALNDIVGIAKIALSVNCVGNSNNSELWRIIDKCKSALSAPSRQCDVGTAEDQSDRFRAFCNKGKLSQFAESAYCAHECCCRDAADCKFAWAQMPYTVEGGAE